MESLDENDVHRINKGRVLDDDDELVKDVIATGLQNLASEEGNKNPLSEYNEAFRNLQAQRQRKPVIPGSARGRSLALSRSHQMSADAVTPVTTVKCC